MEKIVRDPVELLKKLEDAVNLNIEKARADGAKSMKVKKKEKDITLTDVVHARCTADEKEKLNVYVAKKRIKLEQAVRDWIRSL
jgi:hypothetical protein